MRNKFLLKLLPLLISVILVSGCFSSILNTNNSNGQTPETLPTISDKTERTTPSIDVTPSSTITLLSTPTATIEPTEEPTILPTITPETTTKEYVESITVHFIDVGQGDSILIKAGSAAMLIDAGNPHDSDTIINYLKEQGVTQIDYLIGTHPHADHIGGMAAVIDAFSIDTIFMPTVTSNTETFESVLDAADKKGMQITVPKVGDVYNLANAQFTILAPNGTGYDDLNNYSIVIRLLFGKTSFLLTGDAANDSESEMLSNGMEIASTLLKVGHHGSNISSSQPFLNAVYPQYAIISVGADNSYGHPADVTLNRLANIGAQIYRTDLLGTIVATSNGTNITLNKDASPVKTNAPPTASSTIKPKTTAKPTSTVNPASTDKPSNESVTVYITKSGKKYHRAGCKYLSSSKIAIPLSDALAKGYTPCSVCKPPKK